jgi:hypothetical protein
MDYAQNCDSYSSIVFDENQVNCSRVMNVTEKESFLFYNLENNTNYGGKCFRHKICIFSLYNFFKRINTAYDRLFGLVVRVPGYRSRGPGLIPDATTFSDK